MISKKKGGTLLWVIIIILVALAIIFFLTQSDKAEPAPSPEPAITAPGGVKVEFEKVETELGDEDGVDPTEEADELPE